MEPSTDMKTLNWSDYAVFGLMLGFSTVIGLYFACTGKKKKTTDEYLLGGKDMKAIPVAWSLIASAVSGMTFIAVPSEVYTENASYWLTSPALILSTVLAYFFYMPIFYELNVTSTYEYLEHRFNRSVRLLASWFDNIAFLLYLPTVIYIPSLTLSQVTGFNLHLISTGVTAICVFYTMIGGLKTVIWTDFLQLSVTIIAFVVILTVGTLNVGGIEDVFRTGIQNGKLDILSLDPNIFQHSSFITIFFGAVIAGTPAMGVGQANNQRYLSLSSRKDLPKMLLMFLIGLVIVNSFANYSGLLIYREYYGCDPIEQNKITRADQIFPYYILDKIGHIPILPGLFVAGVFSAALSTLSTALNSIAGTLFEDNLKKLGFGVNQSYLIMQSITVLIGIFAITMVFVIENMGRILSVVFIITSVTSAPVYVLFTLGMMMPSCNSRGAVAGAMSCFALLTWISLGATLNKVNFVQKSIYPEDTCPVLVFDNYTTLIKINSTDTLDTGSLQDATNNADEDDNVFFMYKLSYMMYTAVGLAIGLVSGVIVSYASGGDDPSEIDPRLISPPLRRYLPAKALERLRNVEEEVALRNSPC